MSLIGLLSISALAVPAKSDVFLLGFTGFDYEDPDSSDLTATGANYLNVGDGYKMVGFVTSIGPLLAPHWDTSLNEYTVHLFDLTVTQHVWDAPNQFLDVQFANNGRGRYYEDPLSGGTHGVYGTNPPNATSPSTFIDGTMMLGGDIDQFALFYDYLSEQGGFSGTMTQDEGPSLIYIPAGQRGGWILGGLLRPGAGEGGPVPTGYDNQVVGECRIPDATPTTHKTWGALKSLYR
jgi:hypothetical protein